MNDWDQYQKLVLSDLRSLKASQKEIEEQLKDIQIQIAMLKIKASIWGLIGGSIPVIVTMAIEILRKS